MNADNADAEIKVAFLEFSTGAKWLTTDGAMKMEDYYWNDLVADGLADMGEAFRLLEEKLHNSSGFLLGASRYYAPCILLISSREPTDDYKSHLAKLQNNGWFKASLKVALAVGDEANDCILLEFIGSKEAVVRVPDGGNAANRLGKMVQFIAVTPSQVASEIVCSRCCKVYYSDECHRCLDESAILSPFGDAPEKRPRKAGFTTRLICVQICYM